MGEVVRGAADRSAPARLRSIRALARVLDDAFAIPGTRWRFGLDAVMDLVPGVGDVAGVAISGYLMLQAARLGASRWTLARMAGNVAVDALAGALPGIGVIFDGAWKANRRNVRLLEAQLESPERTARASRRWLLLLALGLLALVAAVGALAVWITYAAIRALGAG
jgi:hypothetical protein